MLSVADARHNAMSPSLRRWARAVLACVAALTTAVTAGGTSALAATPAGAAITNVATLRYQVAGIDRQVDSNAVSTTVAERLDVTLVRVGDGPVAVSGTTAVATTLTNTGNGSEQFVVTAATADPGTTVMAIDGDGDGAFDPAKDTILTDGRTPALAPGAALRILVVLAPGAGAGTPPAPTPLTITAHADTGSGTPGTVLPGRGDGGGDAVIGPTGATASVVVPTVPGGAAPAMVKSQTVVAPDGSAQTVRGAVITYTLAARFPGTAAAVRVADPVPSGTAYVPGSLSLDGVVLSDAADADAGSADAAGIAVALGDVAAGTRTIQFQVEIQ